MKTICSGLMLLLGLSAAVTAQEAKPAAKDKPGIYGRVYATDEATKGLKIVAGAHIELVNQAEAVVGQATTDAKGYYSLQVPAGSYFYKLTAPGYRDENAGRGISLQLTTGSAVQNFTLQPGANDPAAKPPEIPKVTVGQLRGQIYEKSKTGELRGVNGARIALRKAGSPAGAPPLQVQAKAPTDGENSSGYLRELESGKWRLSVSAEGFDTFVHPDDVEVVADKMAIQDILIARPPEPEPKYQGLQGTVALLNAPAVNAPAIRATVTRLPGRAGAEVTTNPLTLDAKGKFKLDQPPGRYLISAEADGYLPGRSEITDVLEGKYTTVDLRLKPKPVGLLVKVYCGESKKPLNLATVKVRLPEQAIGDAATHRTDALGETTYASPRPGERQVLVMMPGFKSVGKNVTLKPGPNNELEFYLTPDAQPLPSTLVLRVYDVAKREPLAGATIVLNGALPVTTDLTGLASFTLPTQGRFPLTVGMAGYRRVDGLVEIFAGANERTVYLTKLAAEESTLAVRVYCGKGKLPLGGVVLKATPALGAINPTDANGLSTFKIGEPGRYSLQASVKGYYPVKHDLVAKAGVNDVRIELAPLPDPVPVPVIPPAPKTGRLLIDVVYAGTNTPAPGARVLVGPARAGAGGRFEGATDLRGKVTSTALQPEIYEIVVDKEGYETTKTLVTLVAGDFPKVISLAKKATPPPVVQTAKIYLYAQCSETKAVIPGAAVRVLQGTKVIATGNTDAKGEYAAQVPGPGTYTVTLTKQGFDAGQSSVKVTAKEATEKVLLKPAAPAKRTINVLVRDGGSKVTRPLEGADVRILNTKNMVVRTGKTNALGRARFDNLDVGVYYVEASLAGYVQAQKPATDITLGDQQPEIPLQRAGENPVPPVPNPKNPVPNPKQPDPKPKPPDPKPMVPAPKPMVPAPKPVAPQPMVPQPRPVVPQPNPVPKQPVVPPKAFQIPK